MTEHRELFGLVEKEALSESEKSALLSPDQRMENVNLEEKGREDSVYKRTPTLVKWIVVVLFLALIGLLIAVVILLKPNAIACTDKPASVKSSSSCSSPYKQDTRLPIEPTVFQDLTTAENHAVRDYMLKQPGLNITSHAKGKMDSNRIYLIELYIPKKSDVLAYLDRSGKKPTRQARVIVANGAKNPPDVEEYLVEPLPNPSRHSKLKMAGYSYPIHFASRPYSSLEDVVIDKMLTNATRDCYTVLKESFGFWYHNCTSTCLTFVVDGVAVADQVGQRQSWVMFFRNRRGLDLLPVPFEVLVDHADRDTNKWKILKIYYNNQFFESTADLVTKYTNNQLNKTRLLLTKDMEMRASFDRRGKSFLKKPMRGPAIVNPDGHRFNIEGRKVNYLGWQFHFGIRSSAGPALYDIRFNDSRVVYELTMQEAISFYSAYDPRQSAAQYLDSAFKFGSTDMELLQGVDCPENALYVDSSHFVDTAATVVRRNSACLFEINNGVPLRRHVGYDWNDDNKFTFVASLQDHALVLRSILVPQNYDYIADYIFYQTGSIEVRLSTSGYILATTFYPPEAQFASEGLPHVAGTIHDHMILFKADIDVAGQQNSYQTLDVVVKNVTCSWNRLGYLMKKTIEHNTKKTEKEALLNYDFDLPKYLVFYNEKVKNHYGNPKGYRIANGAYVKQKYPDDYYVTKSSAWTKYQMIVTKHKDNERYGSSVCNQYGMGSPAFDFDHYTKDNESIVNEDLVAWVPMGVLHIPNTEDIPVTTTPANRFSFFIRPFGYFDEDPSMSATSAVQVTRDANGKNKVETHGTPSGHSCPIPDRKFSYHMDPY